MTAPTPRVAPATPSQSPFVVKARELEAKLQSEAEAKSGKKTLARHAIEAQLADLRHIESLRMSGGDPRLPRGEMLRRPLVAAAEKNPDLHIRWINERMNGRVDLVTSYGYRKLSEEEGQKQMGESALYGIPRERYGELEAAKRERTASRLRSYRSDVVEVAERVVEELNTKYGMDLKTSNILINEG